MIEDQLVAIIRSHRREALGEDSTELAGERAKALDHYHGRPYGNEVEGRSTVVSKDLSEAVDWAMPAILRIFVQSGNIAEFDPVGPEDEELAQQESDVVNHVLMKENDGFMVLHDAIKDALLLKNGYVKHFWEETERVCNEEYDGLTIEEVTRLISEMEANGDKVEIVGQDERTETVVTPMGSADVQVFHVKLRIVRKEGRVRVVPVPVEEVRVSKLCKGDTQSSPFVEHVTKKTRSDLIEMGMDREFVNSLSSMDEDQLDAIPVARDSTSDERDIDGLAFIDRSMDEIEFCEAYIRVDWDGDGVAELRKVVTCNDRIPPGDEWNEPIDAVPITGGVPKRIPHRHIGESLDDDLADLQEIKTTLMRQMLDNIYLTNNNQWFVNERVNLVDMTRSSPGGIKRVRGLDPVSGAAEPLVATPIINQIMPAIDFIDGTKEARTGINRATTGLDPDILKQSTKGAFLENLNRASQKVEMITRMLAETLVKPAILQVHSLLIKHQDKPKVLRLRGKYVTVNPQSWRQRYDVTLKVGIGTGNEEDKQKRLMMLGQAQMAIAPLGLVGPTQAYNLFSDMSRALGFEMPEKYALNPESPEYQMAMQQRSQQPNPAVQVEQMKIQAKQQEAQAQMVIDSRKAQAELQQEQLRSQNDIAIEREKIRAEMELEQWKAQLEAETELRKMQMKMEAEKQIEAIKAAAPQTSPVSINNDPKGEFSGAMAQLLEAQNQQYAALIDALSRPKTLIKNPDGTKSVVVQ